MRKLLLLSTALLFGLACSTGDNMNFVDEPTLGGVVINGVEWARYNVNTPGTFTENPEDAGMLFQWNRHTGWKGWKAPDDDEEVEEEGVDGWNSSTPTGSSWTYANDPCPPGWRVPTLAELSSLRNEPSTWTANWNNTGARGRVFGTEPHQIFLPAGGWRVNNTGVLGSGGAFGFYWSNAQFSRRDARSLWFSSSNVFMNWNPRSNGYSVRCVARN